jgi:hypothetical protein
MWRSEILRALADYASVITDCLQHCTHAEDRRSYLSALAFAGILLGKINDEEPYLGLQVLIENEDKNFGWTYLSAEDAKVAEEAWAVFKRAFETAKEERPPERRPSERRPPKRRV